MAPFPAIYIVERGFSQYVYASHETNCKDVTEHFKLTLIDVVKNIKTEFQ